MSLLHAFFRTNIRAGALGVKIYIATDTAETSMVGMALWWGTGQEPFSTYRDIPVLFVTTMSSEVWRAAHFELTLAATNDINVAIYGHLGFEVRGRMKMSGPQGEFPVIVLSHGGEEAGSMKSRSELVD
ncbi:hypothetical protein B0H10DRAFT_1941498 [Mycena sp. CBHHK59/15]|nr:hypothetical protein B0H10DRAFT_1941498 [Mycena sp. CBHHK59/15]